MLYPSDSTRSHSRYLKLGLFSWRVNLFDEVLIDGKYTYYYWNIYSMESLHADFFIRQGGFNHKQTQLQVWGMTIYFFHRSIPVLRSPNYTCAHRLRRCFPSVPYTALGTMFRGGMWLSLLFLGLLCVPCIAGTDESVVAREETVEEMIHFEKSALDEAKAGSANLEPTEGKEASMQKLKRWSSLWFSSSRGVMLWRIRAKHDLLP